MLMSTTSDDERTGPKLSDPTTIDAENPFGSTDEGTKVDIERQTQLTLEPQTSLVRRNSFRELPPGSVVGDTYEIDARLGAGAMGEVYAARHVNLGKRVAIKVIGQRLSDDADAIERFTMEARTLAQIQHPAIVAVEHVGELADGRAYFVMEFLRGESLFERLQRGRVSLPEALRILDQMARGLDAAHGEGVTHRDLKPENTFLVQLPGEPPTIKLLDFGLAKLAADHAGHADVDRRAERTQSGVAIGTPMYMSPEQMRGPDVDHRTDIYALGCVAYELVLGVPPFAHAKTTPELYAAHLHEAPPLPRSIWPEIPPQLDLALFALLAKDPAHRPTLAQFRAVIAGTRVTTPSQRAATEFVGPRAPITTARKLTILTVMVIAIAALIGGISIGMKLLSVSKGPPSPTAPITPTAPKIASPAVLPPDVPAPSPVKTPRVAEPVRSPSAPSRGTKGGNSSKKPPTVPQNVASDAGVEPDPSQAPKYPPVVDRNQTINPFKRKVSP
jgi:serine/threonine-protein kinase